MLLLRGGRSRRRMHGPPWVTAHRWLDRISQTPIKTAEISSGCQEEPRMSARSRLITQGGAMTRRTFLQSLGIATGGLVLASQASRAQAQGANLPGPDFQLKA